MFIGYSSNVVTVVPYWGAMRLSVLFPDHRKGLGLDDPKVFEGMKEAMEEHREKKNWVDFEGIAMNLAVLASEESLIDSHGDLRIVPKLPRIGREPTPLPAILLVA